MNTYYDIIGDVHGHAAALETLLIKMGYQKDNGVYSHPRRQAIFVGDLIDRGPENFRTLEIVRAMTGRNHARIVLGNHEYNALCFHAMNAQGEFLRPHTPKNIHLHQTVLNEIQRYGDNLWQEYLEWFREMPFFLDLGGMKVVHACWNPSWITYTQQNHLSIWDASHRLTDEFLEKSCRKECDEYWLIETLLKGEEIPRPSFHPGIYDRDQILRKSLRLKWWLSPAQWQKVKTYGQAVRADAQALEQIESIPLPVDFLEKNRGYVEESDHGPVFFGHYWFTGQPQILGERAVCLDYSVARGGQLAAYRWDGEPVPMPEKFVLI